MQRGRTFVQYITFQPNVTFDDPATPDGRSWNTALKRVCQTQGWSELDWGPRLGHKEVVDLLICKLAYYDHYSIRTKSIDSAAWVRHFDLLLFMANEYQAFLEDIRTLFTGEGYSSPLSAPFVVESGMRAVDLGIVSSIYELEFGPAPSADVEITLHIDIQLCRSLFRAATERLKDGDHFLKMDACWIEEQISQFPSPSSQTCSTTQMDQVTLIPGTKLFLMTEWESADGEKKCWTARIHQKTGQRRRAGTLQTKSCRKQVGTRNIK